MRAERASFDSPKPNPVLKRGGDKFERGDMKAIAFRSKYDEAAFKRWLGILQQRRKFLRTPTPKLTNKIVNSLTNKFVSATYPWTIDSYPGNAVMLAWVIGVKVKTAQNYLSRGLSKPAALRAAGWARAKAAELVAIAEELERGEAAGGTSGEGKKNPAEAG